MLQVTIDRFENNMAVVELGKDKFSRIPSVVIPGAKEGDIITIIAKKESQYMISKRDNEYSYVLTPKGKYALPHNVMDGAKPGEYISFEIDHDATAARKSRIRQLMDNLFE